MLTPWIINQHTWFTSPDLLSKVEQAVSARASLMLALAARVWAHLQQVEMQEAVSCLRGVSGAVAFKDAHNYWLVFSRGDLHVLRWSRPMDRFDYRRFTDSHGDKAWFHALLEGKVRSNVAKWFRYGDARDSNFIISAEGETLERVSFPNLRRDDLFALMQFTIDLREQMGLPSLPDEIEDMLGSEVSAPA